MAKRRVSLDDFEQKQALKKKDGLVKAKRQRVKVQLDLPPENQIWLTPKQAAAVLSLGQSTLAKMRLAGAGPDFVRPCSNSVRYHREALNRWMASTMAVPEAAE
jgi:hypothetical protein